MIEILSQNPILLLFLVASLGYLIGTLRFKGNSLGVAAVLFTGLAFGAIDPSLQIPDIIFQLGLVLFVYSIGISSGPAFFASYKKNGFRDFLFIVSMLAFSGLVAALMSFAFDFSAATITGAYAGSTTNTPALAGVIDYISTTYDNTVARSMIDDAVVGYSFSYPMGVMGGILVIVIMEKLLKIDYKKEKHDLRKVYSTERFLSSATVKVSNEKVFGKQLRDLFRLYDWDVVVGRIFQDGKMSLSNYDSELNKDDLVMLVGSRDDLNVAIKDIGEEVKSDLDKDRTRYDVRRIFVSKNNVVGKSIASLRISEKFNAIITRIRRGDVDMLATGDTVLEMGDRLRFVARREDLRALSKFFGDSYKASSKVNLFSFGLGIGLGLIIGNINISIGEVINFKLGYAGGPLLVSLILGALRRTGPIVWTLPYSANVTLQQIGLILFLSGIGVSSGYAFISNLSMDALWVFIASIAISMLTAMAMLFIGYKLVKIPFSLLTGIVSNQPAILDFATRRSGNRIPEFGYAMVFPIALIFKIIIAQILFVALAS